MGCKCGPTIANLYLYTYEINWLNENNPVCYGRFIDDIMVANETPLDINIFKNTFNYLKLNIETGEKINFLDLIISYDFLTNKFITSLYTKPTNTFSYLISISNHPEHIFKNIPKSLFIRLRRICSSYLDYIFQCRILINQLEKRGYNFPDP